MTDDQRSQDELFALLERDLPRVPPSPELFDRIVERGDETLATRLRRRAGLRGTGRRWAGVPALAGLAAVLVAVVVATSSTGEKPALEVPLASERGNVTGTLAVFDPQERGGHVVLTVDGLEQAPAGHHYTAWILDSGTNVMTPIGSFDSAGATTELRLPLPGAGRYGAFDISLQADKASPEHSGVSVAGARLN